METAPKSFTNITINNERSQNINNECTFRFLILSDIISNFVSTSYLFDCRYNVSTQDFCLD